MGGFCFGFFGGGGDLTHMKAKARKIGLKVVVIFYALLISKKVSDFDPVTLQLIITIVTLRRNKVYKSVNAVLLIVASHNHKLLRSGMSSMIKNSCSIQAFETSCIY